MRFSSLIGVFLLRSSFVVCSSIATGGYNLDLASPYEKFESRVQYMLASLKDSSTTSQEMQNSLDNEPQWQIYFDMQKTLKQLDDLSIKNVGGLKGVISDDKGDACAGIITRNLGIPKQWTDELNENFRTLLRVETSPQLPAQLQRISNLFYSHFLEQFLENFMSERKPDLRLFWVSSRLFHLSKMAADCFFFND